jgi:PIN domain nuclease of toxin-antitoxin system
MALNGIGILHISIEHTAAVTTLPFYHRDPFDRLLVAQSKIENITLISADPAFDAYGVKRAW